MILKPIVLLSILTNLCCAYADMMQQYVKFPDSACDKGLTYTDQSDYSSGTIQPTNDGYYILENYADFWGSGGKQLRNYTCHSSSSTQSFKITAVWGQWAGIDVMDTPLQGGIWFSVDNQAAPCSLNNYNGAETVEVFQDEAGHESYTCLNNSNATAYGTNLDL